MAVRVMNSYNGYAARNAAGMARKKDAEQAVEKAGSRPETTADYVRELEKLVPSVELRVGKRNQGADKRRRVHDKNDGQLL